MRTTVATRSTLARVQDKLPPGPRLFLVAPHRDAAPSDRGSISSPSPRPPRAGYGRVGPTRTSPTVVIGRRTTQLCNCTLTNGEGAGSRSSIIRACQLRHTTATVIALCRCEGLIGGRSPVCSVDPCAKESTCRPERPIHCPGANASAHMHTLTRSCSHPTVD